MYEYLNRRYGLALYEVAQEQGKETKYLEDLREIVELIKSNEGLLELIKHPQLSTSRKKELFDSIFKGKTEDEVLSLLHLLIEKDKILNLEGILKEMEKIHLEANKTVIAQVKTVVPLEDEERTTLIKKLQQMYNKVILLQEEIDKTILGGVYVRVGNDVIDGTIKSKFEEIRKLTLKVE